MNLKVNPYLISEEKEEYISEGGVSEDVYRFDCGEGISTMHIPEEALSVLQKITLEDIRTYPHTPKTKEAILRYWEPYLQLKKENLLLTEGAQAGIHIIGRLFLQKGDQVLGNLPTYNAGESDLKLFGAEYKGIPMGESPEYRFACDTFLQAIDDTCKMIYLDNPNNPTGQIIDADDIEKILKKAAHYGICIVIDEAYGDYMDCENSALKFINDYENLVVLRSFSKGFGLAGCRIGYMAAGDDLSKLIGKVTDCYMCSTISRYMVEEIIENKAYLAKVKATVERVKQQFMDRNWKNLFLSYTSKTVPIMLLHHRDGDVDLAEMLKKEKVKAISGDSFSGLSGNCVRFRVPAESEVEKVLEILDKIDSIY